MKVKNNAGMEFNIPDGLTSDFRFVKAFRDMRSSDPEKATAAAVDLVSVVFSNEDEEQRFLQSIAGKNGRVSIDTVYQELGKLLNAAGDKEKKIKNS